ncbi:MAG: hypothetical protein KKH41_04940 [Candidatus Thermoplasmatota archaeon]|nr:hypothetical protein [Euryarchaeota archaeon]MBU4031475.1 hypothetical protein [Candidatus Thermoplasmatota archaeon]MBU4072215.1 hypothetical protein [Candidatus Thermoplasmatota archaeon]MBU4143972.1 hypothetical protein [Candidatus Thermoplasmatota archaeon]MBU4591914.1 hypothetical protein [Candidatus Thermoplasmatota archaeon]
MTTGMYRLLAVMLIAVMAMSLIPVNSAAEEMPQPGTRQVAPGQVNVGIYVVGFGNFDANKGTYVIDFYLILSWDTTDQNFTGMGYEFMNGRASSTTKIEDNFDPETNTREVWYRIQASLYSEPDFSTYPFNEQNLRIIMEDSLMTSDEMTYVADTGISGLDPEVGISGWQIKEWTISETDKYYEEWDESYSRLIFDIHVGRAVMTTGIKTLLPPIIFCIVSGLSFAFRPDKITNRIGFGTSMLISAVMFHISQTSSLPPMPMLMTIDKIMIATYAFLAASLLVTTVIYIDEEYWKEVDYSKQVNYYGAIIAIALPFIVYIVLNL